MAWVLVSEEKNIHDKSFIKKPIINYFPAPEQMNLQLKPKLHHLPTKSPPKRILQENQSKTAKLKAEFQVGATSKRH